MSLLRRNRSADDVRRQNKLSRAVRKRDGDVCHMQVLLRIPPEPIWVGCGERATETAHIYQRAECGDVWDDPDVCLRACRRCHRIYDGLYLGEKSVQVRVPPAREHKAWLALCRAHDEGRLKVMPARRVQPDCMQSGVPTVVPPEQ